MSRLPFLLYVLLLLSCLSLFFFPSLIAAEFTFFSSFSSLLVYCLLSFYSQFVLYKTVACVAYTLFGVTLLENQFAARAGRNGKLDYMRRGQRYLLAQAITRPSLDR